MERSPFVYRQYSPRGRGAGAALLFSAVLLGSFPKIGPGIGAFIAASGVALLFACRGVTVDPRARTITQWSGVWFPLRRRPLPLAMFSHVGLHEEWDEYYRRDEPFERNYSTHYTLKLQCPPADWDPHDPDFISALSLRQYGNVDAARREGEPLAKALGLPFEDYTQSKSAKAVAGMR